MGCLSIADNSTTWRLRRGFLLVALIGVGLVLHQPEVSAQNSRFGARAGSRFTPADGATNRRPYRRRQTQAASSPTRMDYRFGADVESDDGALDMFAADSGVMPAGFCSGSSDCCCGDCVESSCGCDDICCDDCCGGCCEPSCGVAGGGGFAGAGFTPTLFAGYELTFLKPRFSENVAFTTLESDGANNDVFTDTEFDYDLEFTPRVWLAGQFHPSWSWRVTYWQFDQSPATETTSPPANGVGEITHPAFGDVDISSTIPADVFTSASDLNVYTIDVEALKHARLDGWQLGVGGGVRYASSEQNYFLTHTDGANVVETIDFTQELEGFGPTISLSGKRPLFERVNLVCTARGSLLYGDGMSRLDASEVIPATATTVRVRNREDLLTIGEARVGFDWMSNVRSRSWQWFWMTAMEGQVWGNAGNATSESADLGFFGFSVGTGLVH